MYQYHDFSEFWSLVQSCKRIIVPRKTEIRVDKGRKQEREEKRSWRKREDMRTLRVSKFETTANKSQSVVLLEGDAWIISQCQVKWLPVSTPKTPPSCYPLLAVPLSCHVTLYFPVHPPTDVWWWGGGGVYRCERSPPPGLDKWAFRADVERMGMKINLI